ncbi:MAG: hypothetical protein R3F35_18815 [Myxococcota bacterium]
MRAALAIALPALGASCRDVEREPVSTRFSGEQIDRIDAGVRSQGPSAEPGLAEEDRPLWVATALQDDGTRMVVHVRLGVTGDLSNVERHEARCANVRDRMQAYLLPGQRVELYLVFDDSVHPCFAE